VQKHRDASGSDLLKELTALCDKTWICHLFFKADVSVKNEDTQIRLHRKIQDRGFSKGDNSSVLIADGVTDVGFLG